MKIFLYTSYNDIGHQRIEVSPQTTGGILKIMIDNLFHFPVKNQRLVFAGRIITDNDTLERHNIKEDSNINIVYIMRRR